MFPRARFFAPDALPRQIRFTGEEQSGLPQKTLDALIRVEKPDPLDADWLREQAFYKARNPGLTTKQAEQLIGRSQRVKAKNVSISQSTKSLKDNLKSISEMVNQGMTVNAADQQVLFNKLTVALQGGLTGLQTDASAATNTQLVVDAINKLNLPPTPATLGLPQAVDATQFAQMQGPIITYILSRDPGKAPIKTGLGQASIIDVQKMLATNKDLVLDLETLSLHSKNNYTPIKTRSFTRGSQFATPP